MSVRTVATTVALVAAVTLAGPLRTAEAQGNETAPSTNSRFEIAPRGYVQFDWRGYPDWPVAPGSGRLTFDTFEVRRARVGVDGRLGRVSYELTVDPQDLDDTFVRDAFGRWRFSPRFELQAGQFKVPGGREYQEAARTLDFMERPAPAHRSPRRLDPARPAQPVGLVHSPSMPRRSRGQRTARPLLDDSAWRSS